MYLCICICLYHAKLCVPNKQNMEKAVLKKGCDTEDGNLNPQNTNYCTVKFRKPIHRAEQPINGSLIKSSLNFLHTHKNYETEVVILWAQHKKMSLAGKDNDAEKS